MNGKPLDHESPVSIFAVNSCYRAVQEGTFFDGSGFAALGKCQSLKAALTELALMKICWFLGLTGAVGELSQEGCMACVGISESLYIQRYLFLQRVIVHKQKN